MPKRAFPQGWEQLEKEEMTQAQCSSHGWSGSSRPRQGWALGGEGDAGVAAARSRQPRLSARLLRECIREARRIPQLTPASHVRSRDRAGSLSGQGTEVLASRCCDKLSKNIRLEDERLALSPFQRFPSLVTLAVVREPGRVKTLLQNTPPATYFL